MQPTLETSVNPHESVLKAGTPIPLYKIDFSSNKKRSIDLQCHIWIHRDKGGFLLLGIFLHRVRRREVDALHIYELLNRSCASHSATWFNNVAQYHKRS